MNDERLQDLRARAEAAKPFGSSDLADKRFIDAASPHVVLDLLNERDDLHVERLRLRRSLFELIELATERSDVYPGEAYQKVRDAKELIRCSVQGCGLGGACNGKGLPEYPCPLRLP